MPKTNGASEPKVGEAVVELRDYAGLMVMRQHIGEVTSKTDGAKFDLSLSGLTLMVEREKGSTIGIDLRPIIQAACEASSHVRAWKCGTHTPNDTCESLGCEKPKPYGVDERPINYSAAHAMLAVLLKIEEAKRDADESRVGIEASSEWPGIDEIRAAIEQARVKL